MIDKSNLAYGILLVWRFFVFIPCLGQEEYDRLRPLSYANANVFLLCFSVTNSVSHENIFAKWYPEVSHFCPDVPLILVGTKLDTRNDQGVLDRLRAQDQLPVTTEQGMQLCAKIRAIKYIECSARTGENLKQVFEEAVKCCLYKKTKKRSSGCTLL